METQQATGETDLTLQGDRQAFFRSLAGITTGTYDENIVAAAKAVTGLTRDMTSNEAEILVYRSVLGRTDGTLSGLRAAFHAQFPTDFPTLCYDFTTGGTNFPFISLAGSGTQWEANSSGVYESFATTVPAIQASLGFAIPEGRTNKCTNYNANPTDLTNVTKSGDAASTLSVVDDTAALLASGLQNICTSGKVYKLDNSAGSTEAFAAIEGTSGNTNAHSFGAFVRGSGGGRVLLSSGGAAAQNYPTLAATYQRVTAANKTPASTGQKMTCSATAGSVIYFILNQLEEGAFATSPIVVAGASATRAARVPSITGPAATAFLNAKSLYAQTNSGLGISTGARIVDFGGTQLIGFSSTSVLRASNGTNNADATLGSGSYTTRVKGAAGFDASSITSKANGGSQATSANAWGTPSGTVYLGNRSAGDRALNGRLEKIMVGPAKGMFDGMTA